MEEHEDKQETQTSQEYSEWTNTSWDVVERPQHRFVE